MVGTADTLRNDRLRWRPADDSSVTLLLSAINTLEISQDRHSNAGRGALLGGVTTIEVASLDASLTCIPYFAWCHRGPNEMRVWFPTKLEEKLASHCWERDSVEACFDGKEPKSSNDQSIPRFTWWDHKGSKEWIERTFPKPQKVSGVEVYWFNDTAVGGHCGSGMITSSPGSSIAWNSR